MTAFRQLYLLLGLVSIAAAVTVGCSDNGDGSERDAAIADDAQLRDTTPGASDGPTATSDGTSLPSDGSDGTSDSASLPVDGSGGTFDSASGDADASETVDADLPPVTIQYPAPRNVTGDHFATAPACAACHSNSPDAPSALRDEDGREVGPFDLLRASMMADASRDPYWRAVVASEMELIPSLGQAIEQTCMRCHTPMAHDEAALNGDPPLSLPLLEQDSTSAQLAVDGVSCTLCHQIQPDGLGTDDSFTGQFVVREGRTIFGPYPSPFAPPMTAGSGFPPAHGEQIRQPGLCGSCHTVTAGTYEPDGTPTGVAFPEQTPYLEWRNSLFNSETARPHAKAASCQDCHVPERSVDGVLFATQIARRPDGGEFGVGAVPKRSPFGRHLFVGGNTLLPAIIRDNRDELQPNASAEMFDALIARVRDQLQHRTATLAVTAATRDGDRLRVAVEVTNLSGHKLPTGYPARRLWLRIVARAAGGAVAFSSGTFDERGRLTDSAGTVLSSERTGGPIQSHRTSISSDQQVQVYEAIMQDSHGKANFHLLTSVAYAKDNRLLPEGWRTAAADARTLPVGTAGDDDFIGGSDAVTYDFAAPAAAGPYTVDISLHYQPIAARSASELFHSSAPAVRRFRRMYDAADVTPEPVVAISTVVD